MLTMNSDTRLGRVIRKMSRRMFPGVAIHSSGVSVDEVALVAGLFRRRRGPENVMMDVGAHFGYTLERFLALGWCVYAFEPDSENRSVLEARYLSDPHVTIDSRALSDEPHESATLYRSPVSTGISTLEPFHEQHSPAEEVVVTTLRSAVSEYGIPRITVLKVDAEGHDLPVLRGGDWDRHPPEVVIAEFDNKKTAVVGYAFEDLAEFLHGRGYQLLISEWHPVVEYGQQHRFRRVRKYPTTLKDDDAWGNLIAVAPTLLFLRLHVRFRLTHFISHACLLVRRASHRTSR